MNIYSRAARVGAARLKTLELTSLAFSVAICVWQGRRHVSVPGEAKTFNTEDTEEHGVER